MAERSIPHIEIRSRRIKGMGWRPSLPDHLDMVADTSELKIDSTVDPRGVYMTDVYNQGELGTCTAHTVAEAIDADRIVSGEDPFYPSRLALYAFERILEGTPLDQDSGAYGRDGYKAARKIGLYPEKLMPYSDKAPAWQKDPRQLIYFNPAEAKLERPYKAVRRSMTEFRRVLSNRQTIGFGFTVYESFESADVSKTGIVPMPDPSEKAVGGHEVLLVGYLKSEPHYGLVRNHWSAEWGEGGYCMMPWSYLLDPRLSTDFRTIYRPKGS